MPDLPDRFRALDQLEVPDIDRRARALGPRPPTEPDGPSPAKRTTVIVRRVPRRPRRGRVPVPCVPRRPTAMPVPRRRAGAHELIAFAARDGVPQVTARFTDIAVARPDGTGHVRHVTGVRQRTSPRTRGWRSTDSPATTRPRSRPMARTIAFVRRYSEGTIHSARSVSTARASGSWCANFGGAELAWSPDGSMFAYYSEQGRRRARDERGRDERACGCIPRDGRHAEPGIAVVVGGRQLDLLRAGRAISTPCPDGTGAPPRSWGSPLGRLIAPPTSHRTAPRVRRRSCTARARWTRIRLARPARRVEPRLHRWSRRMPDWFADRVVWRDVLA